MKDFGKRLKEVRESMGLTQAEFAKYCGVGKTAQYMYERGERYPSLSYLQAARSEGADVLYILTGEKSGTVEAISRAESMLLIYIEDLLGLKENKAAFLKFERVELEEQQKIQKLTNQEEVDFSSWRKSVREWLLTATNPENCIDFEMFTKILTEIETYVDANGIKLSVDKKIKALLMLYRIFKTSGNIEQAVIEETIKLASS